MRGAVEEVEREEGRVANGGAAANGHAATEKGISSGLGMSSIACHPKADKGLNSVVVLALKERLAGTNYCQRCQRTSWYHTHLQSPDRPRLPQTP